MNHLPTLQLAAACEACAALGYLLLVLIGNRKPRTTGSLLWAMVLSAITAWALWGDHHTVMLVLAWWFVGWTGFLLVLLVFVGATHARIGGPRE
ncbi:MULTISPECIES: hypothetical protein [unclassified Luteococcus]|uniref:hypothetical protein n=1 Tax=unclassified Luteococcus TaxID=2639923 RepID=UPI00313C4E75